MVETKKVRTGLSPSSLSLYLSCPRKYYLKKVVNAAIDPDASEDSEAFAVGKTFHKVLEDRTHELSGLTYESVKLTCALFNLDGNVFAPMIYAMLSRYKDVHEKAGLKAHACEVVVETPHFYGIVDVVLVDDTGKWWIGDMKTATSYYSNIAPTLPSHPQLNLYALHAARIAKTVDLRPEDYMGCRYRLTTKSKLNRKKDEEIKHFLFRLSKSVKSLEFVLPKEIMNTEPVGRTHMIIKDHIDTYKDPAFFPQNFSNCTQYYKPCEMWSKCHGRCHSEMQVLEVIESV